MVDMKRTNTKNQENNRGLARPSFRRPYQNQPPPNPNDTLTSEEIYLIFKALNTISQIVLDDTRDNHEEAKDFEPPHEEQDQHLNTINCFSQLPMTKEEY